MIESTREKVCNLKNIMALPAGSIIGFPVRRRQQDGYAMAALLVAMTVMAILMSAALPTYSHMIRREKEEELIFRGEQYARAIAKYQQKYANQSPPTIDVLIEQRFLRKKFRDPMATDKEGEFQLLYVQNRSTTGSMPGSFGGSGSGSFGSSGPGSRGTGAQGSGPSGGMTGGRGMSTPGGGGSGGMGGSNPPDMGSSIGPAQAGFKGPIVGVASKSTAQSIRLYKGKNRYNEWQFVGMEMSTRAGGGGGGNAPFPGGRGAQPQRGGRSGSDPFGGSGPGRSGFGSDRGSRGGSIRTGPDGGTTFTPLGGGSNPPRR
jgi:type II secretory pathway pseudopilin PulG